MEDFFVIRKDEGSRSSSVESSLCIEERQDAPETGESISQALVRLSKFLDEPSKDTGTGYGTGTTQDWKGETPQRRKRSGSLGQRQRAN